MLILKIKWQRLEREDPEGPTRLADEHILFIPAERIDVHGAPGEDLKMDHWDQADYGHYISCVLVSEGGETRSVPREGARLISTTDHGGGTAYWLVSEAWIMGSNGDTIERVAP
jgi:hypothetical protein